METVFAVAERMGWRVSEVLNMPYWEFVHFLAYFRRKAKRDEENIKKARKK